MPIVLVLRFCAGTGGYPCGLWLLFHTMLANADSYSAGRTLVAVADWVDSFFGCEVCDSSHFSLLWASERGAGTRGHMPAGLWLWRVHNTIRARLAQVWAHGHPNK
eukprot:7948554-Pyramimonas_sp.AAC.2